MQIRQTSVMGILNITPDSFSDGGEYYHNEGKAVLRAKQMLTEGADIIDIGGESARPGSENISETEEKNRIIPVIKAIRNSLGMHPVISVDTWKAGVAEQALIANANSINSLGGFLFDEKLTEVVARFQCPIIIYHIKGNPKTMQKGTITYTNIISEIADFFAQQIAFGEKRGIRRKQFIIDPGIGFGKTTEQNITIIKNLSAFKQFNVPILIGVSRKSHLGMILKESLHLETKPNERIEASLAETALAISQGATIIRTHDVIQTKKFLAVYERFLD